MPTYTFDTEKIVAYLTRYKHAIATLYTWNANIERLMELETLTAHQVRQLNALSPYHKELHLKEIVGQKLKDTQEANPALFKKLCMWVIQDWGGIKRGNENDTLELIHAFLQQHRRGQRTGFKRIASVSKVGSYLYPHHYVIYDSRVAYSLNWILLSENAGTRFFPIPEGRNSKMSAFDLNVLIRLKHITHYQPASFKELEGKFISKKDEKLFIPEEDAYFELNALIKQINKRLWPESTHNIDCLYHTEMLLFAIADTEVYMDITKNFLSLLKSN